MRPLDNVTIVDLSQNLAGPYCTQTLGDLGATVLKVESPTGDPARAWGPPFQGGDSTIFLSANRNKTSITLDLKNDADRDTLRAHIENADIFIHSYRKGVIERLGFGAEELQSKHPRLIYCTISAYGENGPLADQPGYDPLMQAHAGIMSVTGHPGQPARAGTSIVDMGTGMWAAIGILAALRERDRTGKGAHVGAALYETAIALNAYHITGFLAGGGVPGPVGTAFPLIAPYDAFATSDGRLMIAAANDLLFAKLCDALQLDDLKRDDSVASNPQRVAQRDRINREVGEATKRYTTNELEVVLRSAGVPCAPLHDVAQVTQNPQTVASGMLQKKKLEGGEGYTAVALPLTFDGQRPDVGTSPPRRPSR